MARGRLISKTLGSSRKFHLLGKQANGLGEFAQALFIMLVTHTDDFGRMPADAFTVKHAVWPASPRSEAQFEKALRHMHEARLVTLYEVDGDKFLEISDFDTHQPNLHKRTASKFPEIPGTPGNSVLARARGIESNLTESNRTEQNLETAVASVSAPWDEGADADLPPDPVADAARWFLESYPAWFAEERNGARYVVRPVQDYATAMTLTTTWPERERLEAMARTYLRSERLNKQDFHHSRSIAKFALEASGIDAHLRGGGL